MEYFVLVKVVVNLFKEIKEKDSFYRSFEFLYDFSNEKEIEIVFHSKEHKLFLTFRINKSSFDSQVDLDKEDLYTLLYIDFMKNSKGE